MNGIIIVKGTKDLSLSKNIRGYVDMRIRKFIDKTSAKLVGDTKETVVINVRTKRSIFEELKQEINELYPGTCVFLRKN